MFYKVNSTKVSIREYLFESGILLVPFVWFIAIVTKTLRLRLPGSVDFPPVEKLSPFLVSSDAIDGDLMAAIASERDWLASQQFVHCGDIYFNDVTSNTRYASSVFLSPNRQSIAWVRVRRWPHLPAKGKASRVQFISIAENGTVVITTSANRDLQEPPSWNVQFHTGKPVNELSREHDSHCERIFGPHRLQRFATLNDAITMLDDLQSQFAFFQSSRGVFEQIEVPVPSSVSTANSSHRPETLLVGNDLLDAESVTQSVNTTSPTHLRGEDLVIAAVRKLETKQTQILTKILLLGVSIAVFLAVGRALWDWSFVLMVIPILFIHELGHLFAMKFFGYKNVNMFFIPFFGAAVTGRHYNVAGWKKALVSLAGPVPSIFLAIVIEIIGYVTEIEWMSNAALLMLILNLFNLLPFLPLDGGWVAHITLFSRSKYLDIGFRIAAILAMFFITTLAGDKIMMYLGIAMLVSLPAVWKTLKVQEKLSSEPLPIPTDDLIPEAAIRQISKACQAANLPMANTSQLAATTIRVYEAVNTRPTSWPATIGLWSLHGGAVMLGLIGLIGFIAGAMVKRMSDIAETQYETISLEIPKNDRESQVGQGGMPEAALLIWQFANDAQAKLAMESLKEDPQHSACRFGTLILMSSADSVPSKSARDESQVLADIMKLPSEGELAVRNDPRLRSVQERFNATDARLFSASNQALPELRVKFGNPSSLKKVLADFSNMPDIAMERQLLSFWTVGSKPSADQLRLRRLLNVIQERADKLPWVIDDPSAEVGKEQMDALAEMTEEQADAFWAEQAQINEKRASENAERKRKWINDGLARSTGETKKMIEALLRFEVDRDAAVEKRVKFANPLERSEGADSQSKFPDLRDYLADSAEALGYVDASAPEYRYGVRAMAYLDKSEEDQDSPSEDIAVAGDMDVKMIVQLYRPIDSAAAYSAIVDWLFSQGAVNISISYDRVVLDSKETATK